MGFLVANLLRAVALPPEEGEHHELPDTEPAHRGPSSKLMSAYTEFAEHFGLLAPPDLSGPDLDLTRPATATKPELNMSIIRISDPDLLLAKAQELRRPIQVSTFHTVTPDERDVRRPGLLLQYSLTIDDDDDEPLTWTFMEVAFADKKGNVDLGGTLYDRLQRQASPAPVEFEVARRSRAI
jgi:hypothetical protein